MGLHPQRNILITHRERLTSQQGASESAAQEQDLNAWFYSSLIMSTCRLQQCMMVGQRVGNTVRMCSNIAPIPFNNVVVEPKPSIKTISQHTAHNHEIARTFTLRDAD